MWAGESALSTSKLIDEQGKLTVGGSIFTDVPSSVEYAQAMVWAIQQSITTGTSSTVQPQ